MIFAYPHLIALSWASVIIFATLWGVLLCKYIFCNKKYMYDDVVTPCSTVISEIYSVFVYHSCVNGVLFRTIVSLLLQIYFGYEDIEFYMSIFM